MSDAFGALIARQYIYKAQRIKMTFRTFLLLNSPMKPNFMNSKSNSVNLDGVLKKRVKNLKARVDTLNTTRYFMS